MINFKEKLAKIRQVFADAIATVPAAPAVAAVTPAASVPPADAVEYTLVDGVTKVKIDKLEIGGVITPTPAAAGTITLDNLTVITYDAAGIITAVTPAAAATPPAEAAPIEAAATPVAMSQDEMRSYLSNFSLGSKDGAGDVEKLAVIVKALFENVFGWELRRAKEEQERAAAIAAYQDSFSKNNKAISQLIDLVQDIADTSVEAPKEKQEKSWDEMTQLEQFRASKIK